MQFLEQQQVPIPAVSAGDAAAGITHDTRALKLTEDTLQNEIGFKCQRPLINSSSKCHRQPRLLFVFWAGTERERADSSVS